MTRNETPSYGSSFWRSLKHGFVCFFLRGYRRQLWKDVNVNQMSSCILLQNCFGISFANIWIRFRCWVLRKGANFLINQCRSVPAVQPALLVLVDLCYFQIWLLWPPARLCRHVHPRGCPRDRGETAAWPTAAERKWLWFVKRPKKGAFLIHRDGKCLWKSSQSQSK